MTASGERVNCVDSVPGVPEVHVQAFETAPSPHAAGEKRQVFRDGAWLVGWRDDGSELFFVGLDNSLQGVSVKGALAFSEPKTLFRIPGVSTLPTASALSCRPPVPWRRCPSHSLRTGKTSSTARPFTELPRSSFRGPA
ncbi:hypothetical protein SBA3_2460006 [Candidatus Sulfopaludibacter sp. SbA3]|nr:hypothetical protein SBA3_2460006 [Candidatus Sulfopaludibacter sp. SbA3]